jgi:hypothetical protein
MITMETSCITLNWHGKRGNTVKPVMVIIVKIHARELTGAETIRGGVAELGHQCATGPLEGYCLMILAAGMFVQDLEAVVEVAYLFEAYIVHGAFKHPVKRGAGVFFHPPAGGIVAVFGNKLQGGLAGEAGGQIFAVGGAVTRMQLLLDDADQPVLIIVLLADIGMFGMIAVESGVLFCDPVAVCIVAVDGITAVDHEVGGIILVGGGCGICLPAENSSGGG